MMHPLYILGISAYYHDSVACRIRDGEILAAAQEERFTRKKVAAGVTPGRVSARLERRRRWQEAQHGIRRGQQQQRLHRQAEAGRHDDQQVH